jgi:hypothetical protein
MALKKIAERRWTYILYKYGDQFIFSVICGGVGLFQLNLPLSVEDGVKALEEVDFLDKLAAKVRSAPEKYISQSVSI